MLFVFNALKLCDSLQPHYEKVARLFNGPEAVHPGTVLMTRVDCAVKVLAPHLPWFYRDSVYQELLYSLFLFYF